MCSKVLWDTDTCRNADLLGSDYLGVFWESSATFSNVRFALFGINAHLRDTLASMVIGQGAGNVTDEVTQTTTHIVVHGSWADFTASSMVQQAENASQEIQYVPVVWVCLCIRTRTCPRSLRPWPLFKLLVLGRNDGPRRVEHRTLH